ncbi:lactate dehydrogenase-like 2-hydroxyacid dehydrogenase [Wenyingzhuangia heitensis]|uniref:Lactate dehydrogenase-like 2-hydroxyacid dehydrogenase n=1 Tax=Wenyingzhuangia heitensis TaxID=1487859 RepID=A0ABX0U7M4_9FLAO|nr:hypothetical protein [Wenyingzhuangia heitensis]NIJ44753.1 lactate dehydrogenase-like 2-hydroxyacid dehydrogenase [Wenyingzhuangia heitensis]
MGLHLLNICIDMPDSSLIGMPENLAINEQESIVEVILEKVLGYENAIEEYDDNETEDNKQNEDEEIEMISAHIPVYKTELSLKIVKQKFPKLISQITTGFYQLDTPPPKA